MGKKILIIEDYRATVDVLKNYLGMKGLEITTAFDGKKGMEAVGLEKPDLILLDIMLPEMNGLDVLKKLKENPEDSKIPVVIISVKGTKEDIEGGKKAGADDYLAKPFVLAKLMEAIKKYLD